jgi:hypothetical protein
MRSETTIGADTISGLFKMPKPDLNGICNNNYAAIFMEGAQNSCVQAVNLATDSDCMYLLNSNYWTTNMKVFTGAASNSKIEVNLDPHYYVFNSADGSYT